MNRRLMGGVTAIAATLLAGAAESTTGDAEQQLLAVTRAWVDAETGQDEAALRSILDDRLVATFGVGAIVGKEAYVKSIMTAGPSKMLGHTLTDETVVVDGDTGVVVGTDAILFQADGKEKTSTYRYTATYVRHEGRWVVLALHMVRIPPPQ